jgi:O-antigen/teichoic acid export membrane protein
MFSTEQVVGWYGGAYRFFDIVMFLPSILTTVLFPIFSKLSADSDRSLPDTFQRSLRFMIIAGIPMCVLFYGFSGDIIDLFYGIEEYGPSALILKIFAVGVVLVYVDFILGSTILATDKQKKWAAVGFIAILFNTGLNYLAIPLSQTIWGNGGIGAAVATLATEAFILVSALLMLPGHYFRGYEVSLLGKALLSGCLMGGLVWGLHGTGIHWIVQLVCSSIVYMGFIFLFKVITIREIAFLREFFANKSFTSFLTTKREHT